VIHVSLAAMRATMQAVWDYAVDLKERGAAAEIDYQKRLKQHPMGAFHEVAGFPAIKQQEAKYLPEDLLQARYDGALGL
jgi:hypothetical protein